MAKHIGLDPEKQAIQDKKNREEFMLQTNMALQSLRNQIDDLQKQINSMVADVCSFKVDCIIKIEKELEKVDPKLKKMTAFIDDIDSFTKNHISEIHDDLDRYEVDSMKIDQFESAMKSIDAKVLIHEQEISALKQNMSQNSQSFFRLIKENIDQLRQDFSSRPTGIPELKQEIEQTLSVHAIDCSNANLRTKNIEKQMHYMEKRFEHVELKIKKLELGDE